MDLFNDVAKTAALFYSLSGNSLVDLEGLRLYFSFAGIYTKRLRSFEGAILKDSRYLAMVRRAT